jgi:hypothetical protein
MPAGSDLNRTTGVVNAIIGKGASARPVGPRRAIGLPRKVQWVLMPQ